MQCDVPGQAVSDSTKCRNHPATTISLVADHRVHQLGKVGQRRSGILSTGSCGKTFAKSSISDAGNPAPLPHPGPRADLGASRISTGTTIGSNRSMRRVDVGAAGGFPRRVDVGQHPAQRRSVLKRVVADRIHPEMAVSSPLPAPEPRANTDPSSGSGPPTSALSRSTGRSQRGDHGEFIVEPRRLSPPRVNQVCSAASQRAAPQQASACPASSTALGGSGAGGGSIRP